MNLLRVLSQLQTRDGALVASKTTKRKEKKPSTQRQRTEEHIRYPVYHVLLSEYLLVIRNSLKVSFFLFCKCTSNQRIANVI